MVDSWLSTGPPGQMRGGQGAMPPGMGGPMGGQMGGQMGGGFRGGPPGGGRGGGGPPDKWQHAPMPGGQQGGPSFGPPGEPQSTIPHGDGSALGVKLHWHSGQGSAEASTAEPYTPTGF